MKDNDKKITTGEPVEEQAPATEITTPAPVALPDGYLSDGYHVTNDKGDVFFNSVYVGDYAKELATILATGDSKITAAAFYAAFLRDAKSYLRRGTPYGAKATCAAAMIPRAIKLVAKRKAPPILRDMITAAAGAVNNDETFKALYEHLDAVYSFILDRERNDA